MKQRIESVDILRGITIAAMILVNTPGTWSTIYAPLLHAKWHGLTPTDLIFPFFLFIVGISISYAYKNKPVNFGTYKKIGIRSLKLIGLGLFLNWFIPQFPFFKDFESLRLPGVLQRIGVVFFVSAIMFLHFNWKTLLGISIVVLLGYWALLGYAPLNGEAPTFNRASNNWANYIDLKIFGKHMYKADYDPEGFMSTIPSVITSVLGILIGQLLASAKPKKEQLLFISALVLLALGYLLNLEFPINKKIWSSSFVLTTAGWATLILGVLYYIIDVKGMRFGAIFKYAGMNAITVYFLSSFISKMFYMVNVNENQTIHDWIYNTFFTSVISIDKLASALYALSVVSFYLLIGFILYKKKIFIKV
ncbi:MAG: heparan-alpha-glucosaminide N-acetyltransferase domain-containing protein [Flavobacteriaceae bacterium]